MKRGTNASPAPIGDDDKTVRKEGDGFGDKEGDNPGDKYFFATEFRKRIKRLLALTNKVLKIRG